MERYYFLNRLLADGRKVPMRRGGKRLLRLPDVQKAVARAYALGHAIEVRPSAHVVKEALNAKALKVAEGLVGIMEEGGNNRGAMVDKIIWANGGTGPEPWCGDFVAYCYRLAGSTAVQRLWAAVRYLGFLSGMKVVSLDDAQPGDIVTFDFDHTGLFVRRVSATEIETIEGNTGSSGAVSDSTTGGDGVYRKRRPTNQVSRIVRVTK